MPLVYPAQRESSHDAERARKAELSCITDLVPGRVLAGVTAGHVTGGDAVVMSDLITKQ